ncbi:MAG: RDD family protein [Acidobacteriota bacterium]|nr:RDD family protein [Acidobacteriota bacterium]
MVLGIAGVFVALICGVLAGFLEAATGRPASDMIESMQRTTFIGWIGSFIATLAYHSLFEGVAGSTVGKRMLGLQVIAADGTPMRFVQAVKRSLAFAVDALFFGAIAAMAMSDSLEKQRVGDRWAETRVVRRRSLPVEMHPPTLQYLAAFVSAVEVAGLITVATEIAEYLWHIRGA